MTLSLIEDAFGDPANAEFLAMASDLAYMSEEQGKAAFKEQLGLDVSLISVGNTQAYIGSNADHIVVAFRGTESPTNVEGLKDWFLTDAANLLMVPEGRLGTDLAAAGVGALFHQGFVNAIAEIWDPVFEAVKAKIGEEERPLWITGHSLGGALAMFAAWLFRRKFVNVHQIYTYGAPMIGNDEVAKAFDREFPNRVYRFVNGMDPVPTLPMMSMLGNAYLHCNKEIDLSGAAEQAQSMVLCLKTLAGTAVEGVLNATLIDDIWKALTERIGAHSLGHYRTLMSGFFKKS
jgi:predicted lipase